MRIPLVSSFLPDIIQQIHSFLARGVISFHTTWARREARSAFLKSAGSVWGNFLFGRFAVEVFIIGFSFRFRRVENSVAMVRGRIERIQLHRSAPGIYNIVLCAHGHYDSASVCDSVRHAV
jgi:hypothetical protein